MGKQYRQIKLADGDVLTTCLSCHSFVKDRTGDESKVVHWGSCKLEPIVENDGPQDYIVVCKYCGYKKTRQYLNDLVDVTAEHLKLCHPDKIDEWKALMIETKAIEMISSNQGE